MAQHDRASPESQVSLASPEEYADADEGAMLPLVSIASTYLDSMMDILWGGENFWEKSPLQIPHPDQTAKPQAALARRILVMDGAMGTTIREYKLTEKDARGERFK